MSSAPIFSPSDAPVALIGAGAMASALAQALSERAVPLTAVLSRREAPAQALAHAVGAATASRSWSALPSDTRVVLVCVPDDAIPSAAKALAAVSHSWNQTLVAHTSGARPASSLSPLDACGASLMSFHPVQTVTADSPPNVFEDVVVGIEGDATAVPYGVALARLVGAVPVRLSADDKVLYHAAAALASNGLVALTGAVYDVLAAAGVDEETGRRMIMPLLSQTLANLEDANPSDVLTGPVARGDVGTIRAHTQALKDATPSDLYALYTVLSKQMLQVADRTGRLSHAQKDALRALWADTEPDSAP